eukprot:COSAG06_NODE_4759_length_3977_cov_6.284683_4_plen_57_part_00
MVVPSKAVQEEEEETVAVDLQPTKLAAVLGDRHPAMHGCSGRRMSESKGWTHGSPR